MSVRITLLDKIWPQAGDDRDWAALMRSDEWFDALGSAVLEKDLMSAFGGDELALVLLHHRADVDSGPAGGDSNEWTEAAR